MGYNVPEKVLVEDFLIYISPDKEKKHFGLYVRSGWEQWTNSHSIVGIQLEECGKKRKCARHIAKKEFIHKWKYIIDILKQYL